MGVFTKVIKTCEGCGKEYETTAHSRWCLECRKDPAIQRPVWAARQREYLASKTPEERQEIYYRANHSFAAKESRQRYLSFPCSRCGKDIHSNVPVAERATHLCRSCSVVRVTATCHICGLEFQRRAWEVKRREKLYCSPKCSRALTLAAAKLGVSRERVRQLVNKWQERAPLLSRREALDRLLQGWRPTEKQRGRPRKESA